MKYLELLTNSAYKVESWKLKQSVKHIWQQQVLNLVIMN